MKRVEIGRYETTRIAGEIVRAFVPHPLPPDPPIVLDASLQQALEAVKSAGGNLNKAFETSTDQQYLRHRLVRRHLQFETVPYFLTEMAEQADRNLIVWQLCQAGAIRAPILPLSTYFKQHQSTYFSLLSRVRQTGDWEAWLRFFFEGVKTSAEAGFKIYGNPPQAAVPTSERSEQNE